MSGDSRRGDNGPGLTAHRDEQGIVQGRLDEFLNPRGLMQAHFQADKLDKVDFERAWCSSQNRAVQVGCQWCDE